MDGSNEFELLNEDLYRNGSIVHQTKGKWIDDGDCFHCSVYNKTYQLGSLQTIYDVRRCWKYCANCGSKMS